MSKNYWPCRFTLNGNRRYFLWFQGTRDGIVLDRARKVQTFPSKRALMLFAQKNHLKIDKTMLCSYDFDRLSKWLKSPSGKSIDPNIFLDFWNLFNDLAHSVKVAFNPSRKKTYKVYEKLFYGCNLPAIRRGRPKYHPIWLSSEVEQISQVLGSGVRLFKECLPLRLAP